MRLGNDFLQGMRDLGDWLQFAKSMCAWLFIAVLCDEAVLNRSICNDLTTVANDDTG